MSSFKIKWLTFTSPKTTVQDPASRAHRGVIEPNSITMWFSNNINEYNPASVLQSGLAWCWLSTDIKTQLRFPWGVNSLNSFYSSPNSSSCSALRSSRHSRRKGNQVTFIPSQSAPARCFIRVFITPYYVWDLTQNTFGSQLPPLSRALFETLLFFCEVSAVLTPSIVYLESFVSSWLSGKCHLIESPQSSTWSLLPPLPTHSYPTPTTETWLNWHPSRGCALKHPGKRVPGLFPTGGLGQW